MPIYPKHEIEISLRETILKLDDAIGQAEEDGNTKSHLVKQKAALEKQLHKLAEIGLSEKTSPDRSRIEDKPLQAAYQKATLSNLKYYLDQLAQKGGNGDFLILLLDDARNYFFQFFLSDDESAIVAEAPGNRVLADGDKISPAQIHLLEEEGWLESADGSPNYQLRFPYKTANLDELISQLIRVAREVYGMAIDADAVIEFSVNFQ